MSTLLNWVIGHPLDHTQSPLLHAAVYQHLGIDAVFEAQAHPSLEYLVESMKARSVALTAVTLPYKEKVFDYLDECSLEVLALQAANTLIQREGKFYGYNTDVDGIGFALRDLPVAHKTALVIGAGGAARAMGYFLQNNQAKIAWINRTASKASVLANTFGGEVVCARQLDTMKIDLIINTTPVGMHPHTQVSPLPEYIFAPHQVVFDMVYNPVTTRLLKQAKQQQARIISGMDMFIGQGLKQIELLTGIGMLDDVSLIAKLKTTLIQNQ